MFDNKKKIWDEIYIIEELENPVKIKLSMENGHIKRNYLVGYVSDQRKLLYY